MNLKLILINQLLLLFINVIQSYDDENIYDDDIDDKHEGPIRRGLGGSGRHRGPPIRQIPKYMEDMGNVAEEEDETVYYSGGQSGSSGAQRRRPKIRRLGPPPEPPASDAHRRRPKIRRVAAPPEPPAREEEEEQLQHDVVPYPRAMDVALSRAKQFVAGVVEDFKRRWEEMEEERDRDKRRQLEEHTAKQALRKRPTPPPPPHTDYNEITIESDDEDEVRGGKIGMRSRPTRKTKIHMRSGKKPKIEGTGKKPVFRRM